MSLSELIHWNRPRNIPVRQVGSWGAQSLQNLQDEMNRLFQDFFGDSSLISGTRDGFEQMPAIDIVESEKDFKIKVELAGMDPENVEVSVTDGYMTVSGERTQEKEDREDNYLRREMSFGSFRRTISLPDSADNAEAEATFKNGILTIDVPKKAEAIHNPKKLKIKKAA